MQGFLQATQNYKKLGEGVGNGQCLLKVSSYAYSVSHVLVAEGHKQQQQQQ